MNSANSDQLLRCVMHLVGDDLRAKASEVHRQVEEHLAAVPMGRLEQMADRHAQGIAALATRASALQGQSESSVLRGRIEAALDVLEHHDCGCELCSVCRMSAALKEALGG